MRLNTYKVLRYSVYTNETKYIHISKSNIIETNFIQERIFRENII